MRWMPAVVGLLFAVTAQAADKSLFDKLLDVTCEHIRQQGPDADTAQFISIIGEPAWARREQLLELVTPYLADKDPGKAAGAVGVCYRLRVYRPMSAVGDFAKENAEFFARLDKVVMAHVDQLHALNKPAVFHELALYLGTAPSDDSKRELLKIARDTSETEQALICLAWHRDSKDMEAMFPYLIADIPGARSLPYHFRNSYGETAVPYLRRASVEAKSPAARQAADQELLLLDK